MIQVGNVTGQYYSQWKLDSCLELAIELQQLGATELHVWYDPYGDVHHCDGKFKDRLFLVQYYKVFALYCNGHYSTGPRDDSSWVIRRLKDYATKEQGTYVYGQPIDINPNRKENSPTDWVTGKWD